MSQQILPIDLYRAAALNAFIVRGFLHEDAVKLANEAAHKMQQEATAGIKEFF